VRNAAFQIDMSPVERQQFASPHTRLDGQDDEVAHIDVSTAFRRIQQALLFIRDQATIASLGRAGATHELAGILASRCPNRA
jgi:hypothetical protein